MLGTAHLLEAVRAAGRPCAVVVVTSDKCYENRERPDGYREDEPMGGHDVYSMSQGGGRAGGRLLAPLLLPPRHARRSTAWRVATARAGNVVGGGDWARDRIVPDAIAALAAGRPIPVRNPHARPPLAARARAAGRLPAARRAAARPATAAAFAEPWNFGPRPEDARPVREVVEALIAAWGAGSWDDRHDPARRTRPGCCGSTSTRRAARLGWAPRWHFAETFRAHRRVVPGLPRRRRAEPRWPRSAARRSTSTWS